MTVLAGQGLFRSDAAGTKELGRSPFLMTLATDADRADAEKSGNGSAIRKDSAPGQQDKKEVPAAEESDEVQALKAKIIELQNKGKLGFRRIVPCRSVEGFGVYSPLEPGEQGPRMVFYCEPSNLSTMVSEGRYVIDCSVDAILMDSSGKMLLARPNVVKINRVSRAPVMDLFKIGINLQKLAGRAVAVKIVLHDKIKNQSVSSLEKINMGGGTKKVLDGI